MITLNISDDNFSHDSGSVAGKPPKSVRWSRKLEGDQRFHFYTDAHCFDELHPNRLSIAWLLESQAISPHVYANFHKVADKFDVVLTHASQFLSLPNAVFSAGGGIWVGSDFGGGEIKIYPKSQLCSIVSSNKLFCPLHKFRHDIATEYSKQSFMSNKPSKVDVFGLGDWQPIINSLSDYAFSIIIENNIDSTYYTEKLLNCFATGTVPIYCGATNIGDYFNDSGIIKFSTKEELYSIVDRLTMEDYYKKTAAIEENFKLCHDYEIIEDRFLRILDSTGTFQ